VKGDVGPAGEPGTQGSNGVAGALYMGKHKLFLKTVSLNLHIMNKILYFVTDCGEK